MIMGTIPGNRNVGNRDMKNTGRPATLILLIGISVCAGCASHSHSKSYFSKGGLATDALHDHIQDSLQIDRGAFSEPEAAFLTEEGRAYVKTHGKLASASTNATCILELPVKKRMRVV